MKQISSLIILIFTAHFSFGQIKNYPFKREILGHPKQWNLISIPEEINKVIIQNPNFRIYGINQYKDSIEAPFILISDEVDTRSNELDIINVSQNRLGFYYTFINNKSLILNHFDLKFDLNNFNWNINLEGSHDQKNWYEIVKSKRLVSVKEENTHFEHTSFSFPTSDFKYFRLFVPSPHENPLLKKVRHKTTTSFSNTVIFKNFNVKKVNNQNLKTSTYLIVFKNPIYLNQLKVFTENTNDYYRPISILYKNALQMHSNFLYLHDDFIEKNSSNHVNFPTTIVTELKINIENFDNQPLKINHFEFKGYQKKIIAQLEENFKYYFVYGENDLNNIPTYDLEYLKERIPNHLNKLTLGSEIKNPNNTAQKKYPTTIHKIWLWIIMAVIIIILLYFSIKMLQNEEN